jgi:hypothetical protein
MEEFTYSVELNEDLKSIESWTNLIKRMNPQKDILRQIKLHSILNESCMLNITDVQNMFIDSNSKDDILLRDAIATVKSIQIIINKDSTIREIKVNVRFFTTQGGETYSKIKNNLKLYPVVKESSVIKFFLS